MSSPLRTIAFRAGLALSLLTIGAAPTSAVTLDVPDDHPTLQAAIADAAVSLDVDNVITISVSPVLTSSTITVGAAFNSGRRLVIRPANNLDRASIVNDNPVVRVIEILSAEYVTLQDLDILRNITNGEDIVYIELSEEIVIERCRIGSHFTTTGTSGWSNVFMRYPTEIVLRNNILFANAVGTFDYGIYAENFSDPKNSLRLYNNVVTDHNVFGILVDANEAGSLVLLRNNVVVNDPGLITEPFAYRTDVSGGPTVVTSHNVAFASVAKVQSGAGQDIAGLGSAFLNFTQAAAALAFDTSAWSMVFDANPDYYRLLDLGPLHDDAGDYGMTVTNAASDIEVVDDIEKDFRPGGITLHTDRGADQLEPGTGNSVPAIGHWALLLLLALVSSTGAVILRRGRIGTELT